MEDEIGEVIQDSEFSQNRFLWDGSYARIIKDGAGHELVEELKKLICGRFRLRFRVSNIRSGIYLNGKPLCVRRKKFGAISLCQGARLIEGVPYKAGGSNNYPIPSFKGDTATFEVDIEGFPVFSQWEHQYKLKILSLVKL